jgi:hypothetical protein
MDRQQRALFSRVFEALFIIVLIVTFVVYSSDTNREQHAQVASPTTVGATTVSADNDMPFQPVTPASLSREANADTDR